jgi:HNH endonuclease
METLPNPVCLACRDHDCTIPYGLCHCGCGKTAYINSASHQSRGWVKGVPRTYLRGHSTKPGGNRGHIRPPVRFEVIDGKPCVWIPLTGAHWTVVLEKDYPLVKVHKWRYMMGYVARWNKGGGVIFMHQVLCPCEQGSTPDHRDRNRLNNRSDNLRPATRSQNMENRGVPRNNRCGITGVTQTRNGKWQARIHLNKKLIHLGTYWTMEDASAARRRAEMKYFGEFMAVAA